MNKKIGTLSAIAAVVLSTSAINLNAQGLALPGTIEIPSDNGSYINAEGNAVRTGLGDCLRQGSFSDDAIVNACEGIEEVEEAEPEPEPEPEPAPAPEPVEKEPIVTTATLGGEALFALNSAELTPASEQALASLVSELEAYQEISAIEVVGHTDATGEEDYNLQLSERRAASVEAFLQAAYPDATVSSRGLGESSPIATNSTREGRALNRRVEIQVTAKSITE